MDLTYLSIIKTNNKNFNFVRFLISIIAGYSGESINFDAREQAHGSSKNNYVTLLIKFTNINSLIRKTIERLIIILLNRHNLYYIETFLKINPKIMNYLEITNLSFKKDNKNL